MERVWHHHRLYGEEEFELIARELATRRRKSVRLYCKHREAGGKAWEEEATASAPRRASNLRVTSTGLVLNFDDMPGTFAALVLSAMNARKKAKAANPNVMHRPEITTSYVEARGKSGGETSGHKRGRDARERDRRHERRQLEGVSREASEDGDESDRSEDLKRQRQQEGEEGDEDGKDWFKRGLLFFNWSPKEEGKDKDEGEVVSPQQIYRVARNASISDFFFV